MRSKESGRVSITAEPLPVSANFLSRDRGLVVENIAAQWITKRGWLVRERRLKTPFAEIDLLAAETVADKSVILHVIEVKSLSNAAFFENRVSHRQKSRLLNARTYLQSQTNGLVSLDLLTVDSRGRVEFFADFLS